MTHIVDTSPPDSGPAGAAWIVAGVLMMLTGPALTVYAWFTVPYSWEVVVVTALALLTIPLGLMVIGVTNLKRSR